jgi:catechol 2,3-dioxygenase-like lactoylglutathione lyase family enzyme
LLFNKVSSPAPFDVVSAIWHIGWGAEDMPATYRKQLDMGTVFQTPITDISGLANSPGFYYAYVDGPEHELIELNTSTHHHFGHLHLFSEDPIAAGEWYANNFGAVRRGSRTPSREPRFYKGFQVAPAASLMMDNVNIIIFPKEHARQTFPDLWKDRKSFESSKNRAIDHIAFSVDDLPAAKERLRKAGIAVDSDGFLEGPDKIRIELVADDHK